MRLRLALALGLLSLLVGCGEQGSGADAADSGAALDAGQAADANADSGDASAGNSDAVAGGDAADASIGDPLSGWSALANPWKGGALASAWSAGVGGAARRWALVGGDGTTGRVLQLAGDTWTQWDIKETGLLWWVHGDASGRRAAVGDGGVLLTWTEGAKAPTVTVLAPLATDGVSLYGVWFAEGGDGLWLVGGNPKKGQGSGILWRLPWTALETKDPASKATKVGLGKDTGVLYKVLGTPDGQRFAVGDAGQIWRGKGDTWALEATIPTDVLIGIAGAASDALVTVGGRGTGVVARRTAKGWAQVAGGKDSWISGLSAVAALPGGAALVAGSYGFLGKQDATTKADELPGVEPPLTDLTLHGAWADAHTQVVVGGSFENTAVALVGVALVRGAALPALPKP